MLDSLIDTPERAESEDRVRAHSPNPANTRVNHDTRHCLEALATEEQEAISRHIAGLEREWDIERYLQANASLTSMRPPACG